MIVPTLNEAAALPGCVESIRTETDAEIVVSDGESVDGTLELAKRLADRVVVGPRGRGGQLNRGAAACSGSHLLFLHADARLGEGWQAGLDEAFERPAPPLAAAFRIRYDGDGAGFRLLEAAVHSRALRTGLVYGDHGLALSRETFFELGGYPDQPIMEDVELCRKLLCPDTVNLELLDVEVSLSARRQGAWPLLNSLRNSLLLAAYRLGLPAEAAYRLYYRRAVSRGDTLLVFLKAPVEGRVKTRLAASVGARRARELYIEMAKEVVAAARRRRGLRLVLVYDPAPEFPTPDWLGWPCLEWWPQPEGDLGRRLEVAFRRAFDLGAGRSLAIGADSPGLPPTHLDASIDALAERDAVLGPTEDGGFYLVGLRRGVAGWPALFKDIPWSSGSELSSVRHAARMAGISTASAPLFYDIDTVEDLRRWKR